MLQQHTREQLANCNRAQLWELCRERGLKCYPKSADCVEAIWSKQQSIEKVTVVGDEGYAGWVSPTAQVEKVASAEEQPKSCATCPLFKPFNDGTGRGLCCGVADTSLVVRDHHTQTQDCQNLINEQANTEHVEPAVQIPVVQSGSLTFKKAASADPTKMVYEVFQGSHSLGIIVKDLEGLWSNSCDSEGTLRYATPYEAAAAFVKPNLSNLPTTEITTPEIEVDSDIDADFGTLYRVWNSRALLGTFYRASDGKWIAQPCNSDDRPQCNTAAEAQLLIVALSGLLVVDTHSDEETDALLDKPFDELTPDDWKRLKRQEFLQPIAA